MRPRVPVSYGPLLALLLLVAGLLLPAATATAADNGTWGCSRRPRPAPR